MGLLDGKVCLVTGTNRGIGAGIIESFAKEGAIVYANARQEGSLEEISVTLNEKYEGTVIPAYFDITNEVEVKDVIMKIKKEYKHLDVLVNNAGIMQDALIGMINKPMMEEVFNVNVFATINLMQMATKLMKRDKRGSIINFTRVVGIQGNIGQTVYSASKGAVIALTKTAAKELAKDNIRVNAIAPGVIDTDLFRSVGEEKAKEKEEKILMGRLGTPEDVANACVFLASDMSSYVTGQVLSVDGAVVI